MKKVMISLMLVAGLASANEMKDFVGCVENGLSSEFPQGDFIDEKGKERGMFDTMDRFEVLLNKTCQKESVAFKTSDLNKTKKSFTSVSLVLRMQNMYNAGFAAGRLKEDAMSKEDKKYQGFKKELADFLAEKKNGGSSNTNGDLISIPVEK